ncbi:hypothetical protein LUZ60_010416 [Juncus effusus]|nr:hypothetical protein LUZ60_010416 [Juncus effusus]
MNRKGEESDRPPWEGRDRSSTTPLGYLIFGIFGATVATAMIVRLRRTAQWFYYSQQVRNSESNWSNGPYKSGRSEEAWIRYRRRMQEIDEDERERVERIRRMQSVFNRERNKHKRNNESWTGTSSSYQHSPRDDWYYRASQYYYKKDDDNYRFAPEKTVNSHHYSILGLDRYRSEPYSDDEIKSAFRKKALEFHPDQNQHNTQIAEAKFKEVMVSYEAIKTERKNISC